MCCARAGEARLLLTFVPSLFTRMPLETSFHRRRDQSTFGATGKGRGAALAWTASTDWSAPLIPPCLLGTADGSSIVPASCRAPPSDQSRWRQTLASSRSWTCGSPRTIRAPRGQIDVVRLQHRNTQLVVSVTCPRQRRLSHDSLSAATFPVVLA